MMFKYIQRPIENRFYSHPRAMQTKIQALLYYPLFWLHKSSIPRTLAQQWLNGGITKEE